MVPWIRCLETILQRFPQAQDNRHLAVLFRSLQSRHDFVAPPHDLISNATAFNRLMERSLGRIAEPTQRLDPKDLQSDYDYARRELPRYAEFLSEEEDLFRPDVSSQERSQRRVEQELGLLGRDLETSIRKGSQKLGKSAGMNQSATKTYCSQYWAYIHKLSSLKELIEYKEMLSQMDSQGDQSQLKRLQIRVSALMAEVYQQRQEILIQVGTLKMSFHDSSCF